MTPEQVAAAQPEAKLKKGGKLENKRAYNAGAVVDGGRKYRATYYYDDQGLAQVNMEVDARECEALYRDLLAEHGRPMRLVDQTIMRSVIWHDAASDNRLTLTRAARGEICWLAYFRLADYRDIDLKLAAEGR